MHILSPSLAFSSEDILECSHHTCKVGSKGSIARGDGVCGRRLPHMGDQASLANCRHHSPLQRPANQGACATIAVLPTSSPGRHMIDLAQNLQRQNSPGPSHKILNRQVRHNDLFIRRRCSSLSAGQLRSEPLTQGAVGCRCRPP